MKKLLFNLTDEQFERLGRLAKQMGSSKSEALRRAIDLYLLTRKWNLDGDVLIRRHLDGTEKFVEIIG